MVEPLDVQKIAIGIPLIITIYHDIKDTESIQKTSVFDEPVDRNYTMYFMERVTRHS